MPIRKFTSSRPLLIDQLPGGDPPEQRSLWRTGLLLATSAALGGIAVAIWNRRTLAQMRQQSGEDEPS
jgi:hypothetical protein